MRVVGCVLCECYVKYCVRVCMYVTFYMCVTLCMYVIIRMHVLLGLCVCRNACMYVMYVCAHARYVRM